MSICEKCIPIKINEDDYTFTFKCKNCDKLYYNCWNGDCWDGDGEDNFLVEGVKNTLKCETCEYVYYTCNNHPEYMDSEEVDKGIFCENCRHHFCAICWQHTGILTEDDDEYFCEECKLYSI